MRAILLAGVAVLALSSAASPQGSVGAAAADGIFVAISGNSNLSSRVVGLDVYNDSEQDIGQIEDIAMDRDGRTQAYILAVGGILGFGEHHVAVNPSAVKVSYSEADRAWHASMNATPAQLTAAPEFQYSGLSAEKACINILK
jgi:hypothetical protein